ncbi:cobalt transporter CbiM [Eubacterium sp. F2]|uniref:cobalt transporter CbiM n=1 Tax=Eubacterium sp. F2 TaxID=3381348 RepID=UPI0039081E6B
MHIPDGYIAPQVTIPALAAMLPVWKTSLTKVKKKVGEKNLPTLALGAAFSFTIMMMNVPVAGGSSAHAVGAVLIAVLLGPWAAVAAVSAALLIQALFFGDGGILAYGLNCLNMAVVMPFIGYAVYRAFSKGSRPGSRRSILSAAAGGYIGINAAALLAAVEFGIQPALFHTASGAALYCPYPLSVSVPAMMAAHLLAAGPLEAVITGAASAYVAKAAPDMFLQNQKAMSAELSLQAEAASFGESDQSGQTKKFWARYKALLIPLIVLIALTPLGLLTRGTAWGEWGTDEIKKAVGYVPSGMQKMAEFWKSLMPDYSIPVLGSRGGYIAAAVVGIGLIFLLVFLLSQAAKHGRNEKDRNEA